jgi:hypothetical protein
MTISCASRLLRMLQAIFLVYIGLITLCVPLSKKTNSNHGLTRRHLARRNFPRWSLEIVWWVRTSRLTSQHNVKDQ